MSHMPPNPYEAPGARVHDPLTQEFSWWAVWVAAAAGTGTGFIIASWLSPLAQHWFSSGARSEEELYQAMVQSAGFGVVVLFISAFGYALAGYIAAALAPARAVVHAAVAALVCMITGAVQYLGVFQVQYPVWLQILGFVITLPCAVLGALHFTRRARSGAAR